MAVIGRIRKRVGLLIAFVGISMLLFILGDLVTSNTGLLHRNSDVVGVIGGEKVRYSEFEKRVEQMTENYKLNTRSENIDQNTQDMLREQAWGMFVNENTLGKEYKKLGLSCSPEELYEMCTGPNAHQQVKQAFTDPKTNVFDPNAVIKFLKDLPNREESVQRQWKQFEDAIRDERIANKYKDLIKAGLFVTSDEAKRAYEEAQRTASIRFVRLDYNTIPDSTVKLEDSDLRNYYNANQNKYKQAETMRKIEYVAFDVQPSAEDRQKVNEWVMKKKEEFAQSANPASFVAANSDSPFDSTYHAKGTKPNLDTLFNSPIGTLIGPYDEMGVLKLSKSVAEKFVSDSVKARHILIKIENNDTTKAMALADSLKGALKKGAKFADLATRFSTDQGSAAKGGDLGWFKQGTMVKPFNDACFDGKKGDMPIVISQFGVHLIEVMEKGAASRQIQIATVDRKVEPSQKTYDEIFNKANQFAATNNTAELFDSAVVKEGLNKRIADNIRETDKNVPGLESPRELVRWAYSAKKGDVSKAFTFGDKYVVAHLTDIKEKGILPMEEVIDQVTSEARKAKKAEMLIEKINAAGAANVDALANKLNVTAGDADNISFVNPYIPGIGNEMNVVGTIFGMKAAQMSKPLKGDNGVTVVFVKSFKEPAPTTDYSANIKQVSDQRKSRSDYELQNALKEKANVEDNRGKFY
ncbi:MAG TPA: peptidylprolyl isomerase [Bacteroidia bacterium]|nr:peptidylprolyl isomerase [Bacteroidia bacterium]